MSQITGLMSENFNDEEAINSKKRNICCLLIFRFGFLFTFVIVIDGLELTNCQDGCPPFVLGNRSSATGRRREIKGAALKKAGELYEKGLVAKNYCQRRFRRRGFEERPVIAQHLWSAAPYSRKQHY